MLNFQQFSSVQSLSHVRLFATPWSRVHLQSFPNFSNESALRIRWPKYWSFSFSISPSNEYSGLISFRMDWLDLLAVQGTLKSLLQHHSSKASILRCSAFFIVLQLGFLLRIQLFYIYYASQVELVVKKQTNKKKTHLPIQEME